MLNDLDTDANNSFDNDNQSEEEKAEFACYADIQERVTKNF